MTTKKLKRLKISPGKRTTKKCARSDLKYKRKEKGDENNRKEI